MNNFKYDYTVFKDNSPVEFKKACVKVEQDFPNAVKEKLLVDVDGSTIQVFIEDEKEIVIYDDYDVGAVFVKSEICLDKLFS